jgi:hypothetical protein
MTRIANQKDLAQAFAARGWRVTHDETSMPCGELRLGDRVLLAILTKRSPSFPFHLGGWVTTDAISTAYTLMLHPRKRVAESCPLELSPEMDIAKEVADESDIDAAIADWIAWGQRADCEAAMEALLDKEANRLGDMPARHLAALAATGSVEVLQGYADDFSRGDRQGFVPYISADHVTAALDFAQQRRANPEWLPRSPRMRV